MVKMKDGTERVLDKAYWREKKKRREKYMKDIMDKEKKEVILGFLILFVGIPLIFLGGWFDIFCDETCQRKERIRQEIEREYMYKMERRYNLR